MRLRIHARSASIRMRCCFSSRLISDFFCSMLSINLLEMDIHGSKSVKIMPIRPDATTLIEPGVSDPNSSSPEPDPAL